MKNKNKFCEWEEFNYFDIVGYKTSCGNGSPRCIVNICWYCGKKIKPVNFILEWKKYR